MAVTSTQNRIQYNGNGSTTAFAFPYLFFDETHLKVVVTDTLTGVDTTKVLTTDYTVTGEGSPSGGTVTFVVAPASTDRVTIYREVPMTQQTDYVNDDDFPEEVVERDLDLATMRDQQLDDQAARTLVAPVSEPTSTDLTLPTKEARASKLMGFDADGKPVPANASGVIDPNSVLNSDLAQMAANTVKANATASTANAQDVAMATNTALVRSGGNIAALAFAASTFFARLVSGDIVAATPAQGRTLFSVREKLTAVRTYYVRTDGSDSNDGLANTAGGAFLTIQKAVDVVAGLDLGGFVVTVQVGNGTYTGAVVFKDPVNPVIQGCILQGDTTTPANVVISTTSLTAVQASGSTAWKIQGFKITTGGSGFRPALFVTDKGILYYQNIDFGAVVAGSPQIYISGRGAALASGNYTISGGGSQHIYCDFHGFSYVDNITITYTGTPAFTAETVNANSLGCVRWSSVTNSGACTGQRYDVSVNGVIQTFGGGANAINGNAAGVTATGGQYA
jgi:hypothetical protein